MQAPQLHVSAGGPGSDSFRGAMKETRAPGLPGLPEPIPPAIDLRFPPNRDLGLGLGCGVLSLFSWGEKSWLGEVEVWEVDFSFFWSLFSEFAPLPVDKAVVSEEMEGDVSSSSVLFLFFSLLALVEKKERMSCCFSFSN